MQLTWGNTSHFKRRKYNSSLHFETKRKAVHLRLKRGPLRHDPDPPVRTSTLVPFVGQIGCCSGTGRDAFWPRKGSLVGGSEALQLHPSLPSLLPILFPRAVLGAPPREPAKASLCLAAVTQRPRLWMVISFSGARRHGEAGWVIPLGRTFQVGGPKEKESASQPE